jgi:hypothetical protein
VAPGDSDGDLLDLLIAEPAGLNSRTVSLLAHAWQWQQQGAADYSNIAAGNVAAPLGLHQAHAKTLLMLFLDQLRLPEASLGALDAAFRFLFGGNDRCVSLSDQRAKGAPEEVFLDSRDVFPFCFGFLKYLLEQVLACPHNQVGVRPASYGARFS